MEDEFCEEEKNDEFYNKESIFELRENDEIEAAEEGFMIGYIDTQFI